MDKIIKHFPDPSIDILSMKPLLKVQKLTNDREIIDFVEQNPLPSLSSRVIDHLKTLNSSNELSIQNQIIEENFQDFHYRDNVLNFFVHRTFNSQSEIEISVYYILFSFVSWKINKNLFIQNIDSTILMLKSLLHAIYISDSTLPTSAFLHTIASFLEFGNLHEFSQFLPLIRSFYLQNPKLTETAFALFPHCIYLLFAKKEDFSQYLHELYEILKEVVSKSQNKFPPQIAEETLIALSPSISQLEQTPIFIFSLLARFASSPTITQFLITLAVIIVDSSMKSEIRINLEKEKEKPIKKYEITEQTPGITLHFPQIQTFLNGFDINNLIPFREQENIQSLISNNLILDIKTIVMIMYDNDEYSYQYGMSLINYIDQNMKNPKLVNAFPILIFSFILLRMKGNKIPSIINVLKNEIIFNPAVICDDSMTDLNSLRGGALELFLYEGSEALFSLLNWSLSYPDLFAELIRRLISNLKMCLPLFSNSTSLVRLISNALLYYQKIRLKGDEHIDEVRATLLLFLSNCFDDSNCANKLFSDSIFIRVFLSLAFEAPLRNFIFSQLKKLFTDDLAQQKQQHQISEETSIILETLELSFPDVRSIELTNQFLEVLCHIVNYQRLEFKKELSIISPILFKGFPKLNSSSESFKYILNSLRFLTDTSSFFQFEKFHFEILLDGIKKALSDQNELYHQLFGKISHLMAGERLSTSTTSFIVRQPFAVWLLLETFLDTQTFTSALQFVIDICEYHTINCHQCRKGDVDLFLISVIKGQKHSETDDLCFQLLTLIANNFSSPCVVENYVSMFQFEGNDVPPYFHKAMKYFVSMLTSDLKNPQTIIKLIKSSVIEPSSFDYSVSSGFTLAFWIYVERTSPQYFPSIVSLQDQNGHFFHLFLASGSLRYSHHENPLKNSEQIDTPVRIRQWSFVTITYKVIPPFYYVLPTVNDPGDEEIIDNDVRKALNGPLKIRIGGSLIESVDSDIPCILGPFALYPILKQNQIQDLYSKGIRAIDQIDADPIYIYNVNNRLENQNPSFSSVLTAQVGLTILFPLFTVIDSLLDSAFEAFSSSLMTDPSVELEFAKTDCFSIIPDLLQETDKSQATYHLYLKFFLLMQNLQTEKLKHQLFGSIMTNFDLWIHSNIDNFLLIVKHWSRTLFPSFSSEVSIITPFSSILNQMMIYFHENDILNAKLDLKSPAASKCKFHLSILLQFIATISFDFSDFLLLISYINNLHSHPLSYDSALILREIAHAEPSPFESFSSNPDFLPCLHSLLKIPKVCVDGIDIILFMFTKKFITQISLREEVSFLIQIINDKVVDKELFTLVVQQTVSIPELFSLSCYLSTFFGDQSILKMIKLFQPSADYVANDDIFYPIVTAQFLGKEAQYSILSFLAQCNPDVKNWSNINYIIKIVEKLFEDSTRELEAVYLNALVDILMKLDANKYISLIKLFTKMAKLFIFFREPDEERSILIEQKEDNINKKTVLTFNEIVKKFEEFEFVQLDTIFGLRFGINSEWIDSGLAMKIVELLESKKIQKAMEFNLMLAFFLVNNHTEFVEKHFSCFAVPKMKKENLEPFIALLNRKFERFHIESTIASSYKNLKYDDNIFEKYIKKNTEKIKSIAKSFNNEIQTFYINCRKLHSSKCLNDQNKLNICIKSQKEMIHKIVSKSLKNEKKWRRIRLCLTLPFAPWYRKNGSEVSIIRNSRLCGFGFPALSKIQSKRNLPYFQKLNEINFAKDDFQLDLIQLKKDFKLDPNDLLFKAPCKLFRSNKSADATVLIFPDSILIRLNSFKTKQYFLHDIIEINTFILQNQDSGIEIFFIDGKSILIDFLTKNMKENAMNILHENVSLNNIDLFKAWRNREITTFDFLLRLNRKLSRSFNYPLRHPVFPSFLISNYSLTETNDDISSSDLNDILYSSLQHFSVIANNQENEKNKNKKKSKVSFQSAICENEISFEEEDDNDEISIDIDDLDNSKIQNIKNIKNVNNVNNAKIPSSSLMIKKVPKKKNEIPLNQQIKELKKNDSIILNKGRNQHFTGSVGRHFSKNTFATQIQETSNFANELISLNPNESISIDVENQMKLSEIRTILSDGGTCIIDYYIMNDKFYQRRKILESDDVAANLNLWLFKVFKLPPISMRIPRNLQTFKPFFIKTNFGVILNATISTNSTNSKTSTTSSSNNYFSHEFEEKRNTSIYIDIINKNGILSKCIISKKEKSEEYEFESNQIKIKDFNDSWLNSQIESFSKEFVVFSTFNHCLKIYNKENNDTIPIKCGQTNSYSCFVGSDSYLLVAPESSMINIFNKKRMDAPINTHKFFQSPPLCAAISETFHTIVVGSEGRLIVAPLEKGSSMMSINIDFYTPKKIVITENFGFIVTFAMKVENGEVVNILFLHNIDGKLLKMKKITFDLDIMICWSDSDGIDYLAVTDVDGKIMTGEVYDLNLQIIVKRCMSQIVSIKYCKSLKSLVAVTINGNIFIEPVILNNSI